ncbi:MAG: 50S ribosomal protein L29 [Patescibacteria group bacterium]
MKYKELTTLGAEELKKKLLDLRTEAHELSTKIRLNQEKQTHKLRMVKKDIARLLTYLASSK